uniref:sigma-70 family RNA polymerase sigma factor n=1 Tax=Castellaniella defragrans TaxID=75697 RepID=UPI00333FD048
MSSSPLSSSSHCDDGATSQAESLYREHRSWLLGWLRRKLRCAQHSEDLAQDVFVRVILRRKAVRVGDARALLTVIAKGLVIDHQRHAALEHAYQAYLATIPESYAPSPEVQAEQMQALTQLDGLLDSLPPKARSAFLLSQLDGLTYPEIARRLGVSPSSVQQYMVRAMSACYAALYG